MNFSDFAKSHGLLLQDVIPFKWVATPTVDHPRSGNGRYKFMGDVGWVQNWATMEKPVMWRSGEKSAQSLEFKRARDDSDRKSVV